MLSFPGRARAADPSTGGESHSGPTTTKLIPKPAEPPWLRVEVGALLGEYSSVERPTTSGYGLVPQELGFSTISGGGRARVRAWLPSFAYIGIEASLSGEWYSIDPMPLCVGVVDACPDASTIEDATIDFRTLLLGRYVRPLGATTVWAGVRAGFATNDLQFASITTQGPQFDNLRFDAMAIGGEAGVEYRDRVSMKIDFTEGLLAARTPYEALIGVEVSYSISRGSYLAVGYQLSLRTVGFEDGNGVHLGDLRDRRDAGLVSLGGQL